MPKENTHLFFARRVLNAIKAKEIKSSLSLNTYYYYLGSVIPDAFYYSRKERIRRVSEKIHSQFRPSFSKRVLKVLNLSKEQNDLVFLYGLITHCCLDKTFHPVIDSLAVDLSAKVSYPPNRHQYFHRYIETYLDKVINPIFLMSKLVKPSLVKDLVFPEIISAEFGLPIFQVKRALKRQLVANILFRSRIVFEIIYVLNKLDLIKDKSTLALFYGNLKKKEKVMKSSLSCGDLSAEKLNLGIIKDLLSISLQAAQEMIKATYDYYSGMITKEEYERTISAKPEKADCSLFHEKELMIGEGL